MPDWLAVLLAVGTPILSVGATLVTVAFTMGGRIAKLEEQGRGYQAQIDRLERSDAECEGKVSTMRTDFEGRAERLSARIATHEQSTNAQNTALTTALTRIEATFTAGMAAMKESVDRLLAEERARLQHHPAAAPAPANDFLSQIEQFARIQKMLKGVA